MLPREPYDLSGLAGGPTPGKQTLYKTILFPQTDEYCKLR